MNIQSSQIVLSCWTVTFSVATVTQTAGWSSYKVVNIVSTAVRHLNLALPIATLVAPVETGLAPYILVVLWKCTLKPAGCMCAASLFGDTVGRHVVSRPSTEAIPSLFETSLVTEDRTVDLCDGPVGLIQPLILVALWPYHRSWIETNQKVLQLQLTVLPYHCLRWFKLIISYLKRVKCFNPPTVHVQSP